jgi:hypothetical protein
MYIICSSVRIVRFIIRPFLGAEANRKWGMNPVADHQGRDELSPTVHLLKG